MVGRQAVGPDRDAMLAALLVKEIAVEFVIRVREEHGSRAAFRGSRDLMAQAGTTKRAVRPWERSAG